MSGEDIREHIEDAFDLTPLQEAMLLHTLMAPRSGVYVVQQSIRLAGALDVPRLRAAWDALVREHGALRTSFVWEHVDKPLQIQWRHAELPWLELDFRDLTESERDARLETFLVEDRERGFDLGTAPLVRVTVVRLSTDAHELVVTYHHIVVDGWSVVLLLGELLEHYEARATPRRKLVRYGNFVEWLRARPTDHEHWEQLLHGFEAPTPLGIDKPQRRGGDARERYGERELALGEALSADLAAYARSRWLTPSTLVHAAWAALLATYSGKRDVVFGTTVLGRPAALRGIDSTVGLFVNTVPVRARIDPARELGAWLTELQRELIEGREHESTSMLEVHRAAGMTPGHPLFETLLAFENLPVEALMRSKTEVRIERVRHAQATSYPLTLSIYPGRNMLVGASYHQARFADAAIERLLGHVAQLLRQIASGDAKRVGDLSPLGDEERETVLARWNRTARDVPTDRAVHELFEAQVDRAPDAIALTFRDSALSYRELEDRARQLAHRLRGVGVKSESVVGVLMERSIEMVVALLGVLEAGGAYLPLDPTYPEDRLRFMVADARAQVVLTQACHRDKARASGSAVLEIDTHWGEIASQPRTRPPGPSRADGAMYVLYTSGSTGLPKGVCVHHRGVVNRLLWQHERLGLSADDIVLQKTPFTFDVSGWELWSVLAGSQLVIAEPEQHKSPGYLLDVVRERGVTQVHFVPSMLGPFLETEGLAPHRLRRVMASGEALSPELVRRFAEKLGGGERRVELHNLYGPTEASIDVSHWTCTPATVEDGVPIGRPIQNTQLYVLDDSMRPAPIGVEGELYIGGTQVARGYVGRAALSAERFVPDPFGVERGARLYRTGDVTKWRTDGAIDFLGRRDHQVKVRGFRIELGEIENVLEAHPAVRQAVVVAREDRPGDKRIVAYVVLGPGGAAGADSLRAHVAGRLPEYMVPSAFITLDALPLTRSGKTDRKALPAPEAPRPSREHVSPRTATEQVVAQIFSDVLGVEHVGVHDGFFELGGHSLLATQVASRARRLLGVDLPIRELFERASVAELARTIDRLQREGDADAVPGIERVERDGALPLSYGQERLWFLWKLEPESAAYHMPGAVRLRGALDVDALERALRSLVRRHAVLRTRLVEREGSAVQVIDSEIALGLDPEPLAESELDRVVAEEAARPFDLERGPLLRVKLFRLAEGDHLLVVVMHHVVSDGWSLGVLVRELGELYDADAGGRAPSLPGLAVEYADYAAWQRRVWSGERLERELAYWARALAGVPVLELPTDRPRPAVPSYRGAEHRFELPASLTASIEQRSRELGITEFMTLLAAFGALLGRYTGQNDFAIGTPIAGRRDQALEPLIGFFVNTLALRIDLRGKPTFAELLERVKETTLAAYAHQGAPFEQVVEALEPERRMSTSPVFQVVLVLQNVPRMTLVLRGLELELVEVDRASTQFDLTLELAEERGALRGRIEYARELFDRQRVERLAAHYVRLLERCVAKPAQRISEVSFLTDDEERVLLVDWNATERSYPRDECMHELLRARFAQAGDEAALGWEEQRVSYAELDRRTNRLARYLRELGVGPDVRVGVYDDDPIGMVVGLLAVMKAGGAYLPLDPAYPHDRIAFMLADSGARVVVTRKHLAGALAAARTAAAARIVAVDESETEREIAEQRADELGRTGVSPANVAYVIYTSGSTGRPKGVLVTHRNLVHSTTARYAHYTGTLRGFLLLSSFAFDSSVAGIFWTLSTGGTLWLVGTSPSTSAESWLDLVSRHRISHLLTIPSVYKTLLEIGPERLAGLEHVIVAGEPCARDLVERHAADLHDVTLHNEYGPTEASVWATVSDCSADEPRAVVPIGRPIANARAYVLDRCQELAPLGTHGELFIGGEGVSRGYLHRPALTADRFVPDPFATEPGARLYRTGDLAKWSSERDLEFVGRVDEQVKVRGFRIELGEIEAALEADGGVREAVVVVRGEGEHRRLVAFVVPAQDHAVPDEELGQQLRGRIATVLPAYMVPSELVLLGELPTLPNGKVDRKALPDPERGAARDRYVAPRTPTERLMAGLFGEVLGVERVGARDDFFELGGHSLLATRLVSRVSRTFGVELALRAVFDRRTVEALARKIAGAQSMMPGPMERAPRDRPLALSHDQERLWFLWRLEPESAAYHIQGAVRVTGALDETALQQALRAVARRHEVLRTRFIETDDAVVQVIDDEPSVALSIESAADLEHAAQKVREDAARPFDLESGPVWRALLVRVGARESLLSLVIHHIAGDAGSTPVLVRELAVFYAAHAGGTNATLPDLDVQYSDYAARQRRALTEGALAQELEHWRARLEGIAPIALPIDRPRPPTPSFRGADYVFELPAELMHRAQAFAKREHVTPFIVLLSAFELVLARYGNDDIAVGTPVSMRDRVELEPLVGFFVNTLVLRVRAGDRPTFRTLVSRVRDTLLDAHAHKQAPFERVVDAVAPARDLSMPPLFQVLFTMQDAIASALHDVAGVTFEPVEIERSVSQFDLSLHVRLTTSGWEAVLEHATALFDTATVARIATHYRRALERALAEPDAHIDDIDLLGEDERRKVLRDWSAPEPTGRAPGRCVHELFFEQAARTPNAIAVELEGAALTYRELAARARAIAAGLRALRVERDGVVGLFADRSFEMFAGLLGVLDAGAAYLPLDPAYPVERIRYMLADSRASVVLTHSRTALDAALPARVVPIESFGDTRASVGRAAAPLDGVAYVIYTSGSTGRPKGVAMPHRALANLVAWQLERSAPRMRTLQFAPISFDVSVQEAFATWCSAGTLVLVPESVRHEPVELLDLLASRHVERVFMPFVALQQLTETCELEQRVPSALVAVVTAGEALRTTPALRWFFEATRCSLENQYGPSETHVVTAHRLTGLAREWPTLPPIGKPIVNARVLVLDRSLRAVPIGVAGELHVGGVALARGYLGRASSTAEKFVPDPTSTQAGARLYRTGDLARWTASGDLEFLGRADAQVKVRGYRIELGEIEAALAQHPAVEHVAVTTSGHEADRRLVAYVVTTVGAEDVSAVLGDHLRSTLPAYMVPSMFVTLAALPRTPSGKVDKRALPAAETSRAMAAARVHVAPRTMLEARIASIWREVLGVATVGAHDDFFELGGQSLLAARIASRLARGLQMSVPVRLVFESPTVETLAAALERARPGTTGSPEGLVPLVPADDGPLALSFGQERLWFLWRLEPESAAYNIGGAFRIAGELDIEALRRAMIELGERHDVLRTRFVETTEGVEQRIEDEPLIELQVDRAESEHEAADRAREWLRRGFDLARGPVWRGLLLRMDAHDHRLVLVLHHIAGDGWSVELIARELAAFYRSHVEGRSLALPPLRVRYADYAAWQRRTLTDRRLERLLDYWKRQLAGAPAATLPLDRPRPALRSHRGGLHHFSLPRALVRRVRELAARERVTPFIVLLGAFEVVLYRYGNRDASVGTPVSIRDRPELEALVGFFVNTLVLRASLSGDSTFLALLAQLRGTLLEAHAHKDAPFERVVDAVVPERDMGIHPLFQIMFVLNEVRGAKSIELGPGVTLERYDSDRGAAQFDLTIAFEQSAAGVDASIEYASDLFDRGAIERMASHYVRALEHALDGPDAPVGAIDVLDDDDRRSILVDRNETRAEAPRDTSAHALFEGQAARTPDAIAVVHDDERIGYRELDERANQLAHRLRSLGVRAESRVGICMERSIEMVIAVLAVLKAGGAYVPLDPSYPRDRLAFMAADSGVRLILSESRLADLLDTPSSRPLPPTPTARVIVRLDEALEPDLRREPTTRPAQSASASQLAYVIYTSGSTGKPKGVLVPHSGLVHYLSWALGAYPVHAGSGAPVHSSLAFDATITALLLPLVAGKAVELFPERVAADELAARLFDRGGFSLVKITPAHLEMLRPLVDPARARRCAAAFVIGGENLTGSAVREWLEHAPDTAFVNEYGPTETVVGCSAHWAEPRDAERASVPIGKPIANTQLYVLDPAMGPVADGVAAELYIGGDGVTRGYHARGALTAERFVPAPFGAPGTRLYRTGDVGRWLSTGELEFVGRRDHQVKVRGYRIELGEIEAVLDSHPSVQTSVVIARPAPGSQDGRLVAYVVAKPGLDTGELRAHLAARLPEPMVPAAFVSLEALPLTPNGKIDRDALPAPERSVEQEYVAPRSPTEVVVAETWSVVLGIERIGVHDDFFLLGGHSLAVTRVLSQLRSRLGVELPVRAFFELRSVSALAGAVDDALAARARATDDAKARLRKVRELLGVADDADRTALESVLRDLATSEED